jgi:hypothetical protein
MTNEETLRSALRRYLTERGLWEDEADAVLAAFSEQSGDYLRNRLDHDAKILEKGYPIQMLPVLVLSLRLTALEWINANKPRHVSRPAFVEEA